MSAKNAKHANYVLIKKNSFAVLVLFADKIICSSYKEWPFCIRSPDLQITSMYSALRASPGLFKFDPIEFSRFAASRLHLRPISAKIPVLCNGPRPCVMSVYTTIETDELEGFLSEYSAGELRDYSDISDGIENTNYFVNTRNGDDGQFVLTLFEHHSLDQMQYYLGLMHHLADHQVPSADPVADNNGSHVRMFKHKPAALVHSKDPDEFRAILKDRVANNEVYRGYWI